jgi:hypothetical protein
MKSSLQKIFPGLILSAMIVIPQTSRATVINDSIFENQDANGAFVSRTVDFLPFTTAGGVLTFDILASDTPNGLDDSMIWIFNDDGHLEPGDWVAENDDTDFANDGNDDGSLNELDSFLSIVLSGGNYLLAVGSGGDYGGADMIDGLQLESSPFSSGQPVASSLALNYQLTIGGDFNAGANDDDSSIPEPSSLYLFASGLCAIGLRWPRHKSVHGA